MLSTFLSQIAVEDVSKIQEILNSGRLTEAEAVEVAKRFASGDHGMAKVWLDAYQLKWENLSIAQWGRVANSVNVSGCGSEQTGQTGATLEAILSELNGSRDQVLELLGYGQLLKDFDVLSYAQELWGQPVPDYWDVPRQEVFFIRLRSGIRLQFHKRVYELMRNRVNLKERIPSGHLFKRGIPELVELYQKWSEA